MRLGRVRISYTGKILKTGRRPTSSAKNSKKLMTTRYLGAHWALAQFTAFLVLATAISVGLSIRVIWDSIRGESETAAHLRP